MSARLWSISDAVRTAGNGDPLMALDVAIHTGEVKNDALRLPMSWMRIRSNESASFLPMERRPSQLTGVA